VVHPGIDVAGIDAPERSGPLRVLWNHRWEWDKNPEAFFGALGELARRGADFRVLVCGEQFRRRPACFRRGRGELGARVEHFGFAESAAEYRKLLGRADVGVSTALQESFGIAVLEACAAGCMPLLPDRLSYPELVPGPLRAECIYADDAELVRRLAALAADPGPARSRRQEWRALAARFAWPGQAALLDGLLESLTS
jgi:glycosyltransferase involved in cell wall biosynthesis